MKVIWSEPAEEDLLRIFEFNLTRSSDWALRVDARLTSRADSLARTPSAGRPLPFGPRALWVPDIQYVIIYKLDGELVRVTSVYSTREDWTNK